MNSHRRWGVRDVHLFDCKEVCGAAYLHFQYCSWMQAQLPYSARAAFMKDCRLSLLPCSTGQYGIITYSDVLLPFSFLDLPVTFQKYCTGKSCKF